MTCAPTQKAQLAVQKARQCLALQPSSMVSIRWRFPPRTYTDDVGRDKANNSVGVNTAACDFLFLPQLDLFTKFRVHLGRSLRNAKRIVLQCMYFSEGDLFSKVSSGRR